MKKTWFSIGFVTAFVLATILVFNRTELTQKYRDVQSYINPINLEDIKKDLAADRNLGEGNLKSSLTTSLLPLDIEYIDLNDIIWPSSGGHIDAYEDKVILMSRLGDFFSYDGKNINSLNASVPNNISKYVADHGDILETHLRAYSFIFNCKDKKIYASFMRYNGLNKASLIVSSTMFNCNADQPFTSNIWNDIYESRVLHSGYYKNSQSGGGGLAQDNDFLYLSIGWSDNVAEANEIVDLVAQSTSSEMGKIIKISKANGKKSIHSLGHRNLQDLIFFGDNKSLLAIEQGPQGGDELNNIFSGNNYGWPLKTYGTEYGKFNHDYAINRSLLTLKESFINPIFSFVPSVASSSLAGISDFHKKWRGDILIGSLKAQSIYRLKFVDDRIIYSEPIWIGHRIRSITEAGTNIFILTDDGYLGKMSINNQKLYLNTTSDNLFHTNAAFKKCSSCHGVAETTPNSLAPSLRNVIGREIASTEYLGYSNSLKSLSGVWTKRRIYDFLKDPQAFSPGTSMPKVDLSESEIQEIILLLDTYSN